MTDDEAWNRSRNVACICFLRDCPREINPPLKGSNHADCQNKPIKA